MNPYEALALKPGPLTSADVEKAFKRAAAKAHPDRNGGDNAKMTEVNTARDILLNPSRKKRFDELGTTSAGTLSPEEQAIVILGNLFAQALDAPEDISYTEMLAAMAKSVADGLMKALDSQRKHPAKVKRARRILSQIKCDPILQRAFESRLAKLERDLVEINQQVLLGELMLKLMQSVRFTYSY